MTQLTMHIHLFPGLYQASELQGLRYGVPFVYLFISIGLRLVKQH